MSDNDIRFQSEREWRVYLVERINTLEEKMDTKLLIPDKKITSLEKRMIKVEIIGETLKIKIGLAAAIFGALAGLLVSFVSSFIKQS